MDTRAVNIAIEQLILQETGTYNPMYQRGYTTQLDKGSLQDIVDRVAMTGSKTVTPGLLTGLSSEFLAPEATPGKEAAIANGWQERRIRFVLIVHVNLPTGAHQIHYVQGYTNYPGVSIQGAVDPNMEFIVNSILTVNRVQMATPMGIQTIDKPVESYQVITDPNYSNAYGPTHGSHIARPTDIFVGIHSANLGNNYSFMGDSVVNDTRTVMRNQTMRSNRSNNIAATYVSKVLNSYNMAVELADFGQGSQDILQHARQGITEAPLYENTFMRKLNENATLLSNRFTFSKLQAIDNNVGNVTNFIVPGQAFQTENHQAGQTAYWHGSDLVTRISSTLSQSVPALMMELMITSVNFRSTNMDIGGMMNTAIIDAKSMINGDMTRSFEIFRQRFETEVMYDLTFGNQEIYALEMSVNMYGETWINIQFAHEPATQFVAPTFCDNLFVPVLVNDGNSFGHIVHDFETLLSSVTGAIGDNNGIHYNNGV